MVSLGRSCRAAPSYRATAQTHVNEQRCTFCRRFYGAGCALAHLGFGLCELLAPQQLPVAVYKLALISLAGVACYRLGCGLFPYARPDVLLLGGPAETTFADLRGVVLFTERVADDTYGACALEAAIARELLLGAVCMARRAVMVSAGMLAVSLGA